jgi:hypothetical protein
MTELIWEGKYDKDGKKVAPLRVALPFQTVETVNESAQERQRMLDLWGSGRETEWRNRLIWGDKKYVLPSPAGGVCWEGGPDLYRPTIRHWCGLLL